MINMISSKFLILQVYENSYTGDEHMAMLFNLFGACESRIF